MFGEGIKLTIETSEYQESASPLDNINMVFMCRYKSLGSWNKATAKKNIMTAPFYNVDDIITVHDNF